MRQTLLFLITIAVLASCATAPETTADAEVDERPDTIAAQPTLPAEPSAATFYLRGQNAWDDPERGIRDLTRALEIDPTFELAYFERARTYRKIGRLEEAVADYGRAIEADPALVPAYIERGEVRLYELGDEGGASDFEAAYAIDPEDVAAALTFAGLIEWENPEEALAIHDRLVSVHDGNGEVLGARARLRRGRFGDFAGALDDFRLAAAAEPWDEYFRVEAIMTLLALGEMNEARDQLLDALADFPESDQLPLYQARVAALAGNVDDSRRFYAEYLEYEWADQRVWLEVAYASAAARDLDFAQEALERFAEAKGEDLPFLLGEIAIEAIARERRPSRDDQVVQALLSFVNETSWYSSSWVVLAQIAPELLVDGRAVREFAAERINGFEPSAEAFFPFNLDLWVWTALHQSVNSWAELPFSMP